MSEVIATVPGVVRPVPGFRWSLFLWPPLLIASLLLVLPQLVFVWMSFHVTDGMGGIEDALTLGNYLAVLTDPFYLKSIWITFYLSVLATAVALLIALPTAYALARMPARWASNLVVLLLMTSFVTVVVKVPGLSLLLNQNGLVNHLLLALGVIGSPARLLDNEIGVTIGLVQYTLAFLIITLFTVMQTVPYRFEEASQIHGGTWLSTMISVVLPMARPGIVAGTLIVFNMNMGAFTSAALLGGGRVLTLPVLIQRKVILDVDYAMGATLSTVLLLFVLTVNLAATALLYRRKRAHAAKPA